MLKTKIVQNSFFFYFSISSFLVSSYYFNLRTKLFYDENLAILSSLILFVFSFLVFFILINSFYFLNKKIMFVKIELFNVFFFSWLFVQIVKCTFDLINIISFQEFFGSLRIFFEIENILVKSLLTHFIPYIFAFFLTLAIKDFLNEVFRFTLILSTILVTLSAYDLGKNFINKNYNFNSNYNETPNNKLISKKRAIVIVFDSFDPQIAFDDKYSSIFKNLNKFKDTSFFGPNSYAPAKFTMLSVPSMLMGLPTKGYTVKNRQYYLRDIDNNLIKLNYNNSLFGSLNKLGLSSYFINTTIPICKYFLVDMKNCEGLGDTIDWGKSNLDMFSGIRFNFPIIYQSKKLFRLLKQQFSNEANNSRENTETKNFIKKIKLIKFNQFKHIDDIDGRGKSSFSNIINRINDGYDLIFLHVNLPHPSSNYAKKIFNFDTKNEFENFMLNTLLADFVVGKLMLDLSGYKDDDFMLTVLSDHWYREKDRKTTKYYPSLFMSKILDDNSKVSTNKDNSLIHLKEYLINYFGGKISSNKDIKTFFESKKFYEPYINE